MVTLSRVLEAWLAETRALHQLCKALPCAYAGMSYNLQTSIVTYSCNYSDHIGIAGGLKPDVQGNAIACYVVLTVWREEVMQSGDKAAMTAVHHRVFASARLL